MTASLPCAALSQSDYINFLLVLDGEALSRYVGGVFGSPVPTISGWWVVTATCAPKGRNRCYAARVRSLVPAVAVPMAGAGWFQGRQLLWGRRSVP